MLYCSKCGKLLNPQEKFCANCGQPVGAQVNYNFGYNQNQNNGVTNNQNVNMNVNSQINQDNSVPNNYGSNNFINDQISNNVVGGQVNSSAIISPVTPHEFNNYGNVNSNISSMSNQQYQNSTINYGVKNPQPVKKSNSKFILLFIGEFILLFAGFFCIFNSIFSSISSVNVANGYDVMNVFKSNGYEFIDNTSEYSDRFDIYYSGINRIDQAVIEYVDIIDSYSAVQFYESMKNKNIALQGSIVSNSVNIESGSYRQYSFVSDGVYYYVALSGDILIYAYCPSEYMDSFNSIISELGFSTSIGVSPMLFVGIILILVFVIVILVAFFKIFKKAGKKGWHFLIPIYNFYELFEIAFGKGKGWYFVSLFVPGLNVVMLYMLFYRMAKAFGKSNGFAIASTFFSGITMQIIAFSDDQYALNK